MYVYFKGFPSFTSTSCYCCVLYDIRKLSYCKSNHSLLRPSIPLQVFYAILLYTYTCTSPPPFHRSIWSTYSMRTLMCFTSDTHPSPPPTGPRGQPVLQHVAYSYVLYIVTHCLTPPPTGPCGQPVLQHVVYSYVLYIVTHCPTPPPTGPCGQPVL